MADLNGFTEVTVLATGQVTSIPADWLDSPVFGHLYEPTIGARGLELGEAPTEADSAKTIDAFAEKAGIDLGGASTKADKVAAINAALEASGGVSSTPPASASAVVPNPGVETVFGQADTEPIIPALRSDFQPDTTSPGGTSPSDETAAAAG